jgi:hypothetical protein
MKIYHGTRPTGTTDPGPVTVTYDDGRTGSLKPYWHWSAFNWGYFGTGPKHLAFALLRDAADDVAADKHCMAFKETVVSQLPDEWTLTDADVRDWLLSAEGGS